VSLNIVVNSRPLFVVRAISSLLFFVLGAWLGYGAAQQLWRLSPFCRERGFSFGLVLNFGAFEIREPWSSLFALACAASFFWAGCSLLRRPGGVRIGAIVGSICVLTFAIGFIRAF
jgi:hypothetical protein